jgi:transcription elongation factor GreA
VAEQSVESVVWLTQEAFDRLAAELERLKGPGRAETARRIAEARDEGDLRENGYHAAREEQSKSEARILQLEDMLSRARVGEKPVGEEGTVQAGMQVTVRFDDDTETETFLLGAREVLALDSSLEVSVYSPQSPLGAAITGKRPGDRATFTAPNGKTLKVEIIDAKPFVG